MKKFITGLLTMCLTVLLVMPIVSAWATSASMNLNYGQSGYTSAEIGLSQKAYYTAKNTTTDSLKGKITMNCFASYLAAFYTNEYSTLISVGKTVNHTELQDLTSKYKVGLSAAPLRKETGTATVKL